MIENPFQDELIAVSQVLSSLNFTYVFVGGAVIPFHITDPASSLIRPTDDVDIVVRVASKSLYHQLEDQLRSQGLRNDIDGPVCRWILDDHPVDVMPTDIDILGFSNRWYDLAIDSAYQYTIADETTIPVISPPAFIATKLEAFSSRGADDYFASHDLEDLITVIDGRIELIEEVAVSQDDLRSFISQSFSDLLDEPDFQYALPGHLPYGSISSERAEIVKDRMKQMVELSE
jgi:predicted nucleotidyltransferase